MNALQSLHNGALTGTREQTVLTPACVLDPLKSVWGRVGFDPCAPPDPAWVECTKCHGLRMIKVGDTIVGCTRCAEQGGAWYRSLVDPEHCARLPDNGLRYVWPDRSFCNPAFDLLREGWLDPHTSGERVAWLLPVRPHRKWWRVWARTCDAIVYLDPFAFVGHDQVFPAPLCIGYRGHDSAAIVAAYKGRGETL